MSLDVARLRAASACAIPGPVVSSGIRLSGALDRDAAVRVPAVSTRRRQGPWQPVPGRGARPGVPG